jgi:hypothetical protein
MTDSSRIAALMLACREAACHERRQMAGLRRSIFAAGTSHRAERSIRGADYLPATRPARQHLIIGTCLAHEHGAGAA